MNSSKFGKWISVEERLPEHERGENVEIIAAIKNARRATALYFRDGFFFDAINNHYPVTHWMPMPEMPERKEKK